MKVSWELPLPAAGVVLERDGQPPLRIRPGRPGDREAMRSAFERLSPDSRYQRFFQAMPQLLPNLEDKLADVDDVTQFAWMVTDPTIPSEVRGDESGLAIASARLFLQGYEPGEAEASLVVVDDYQKQGIGRVLMELILSTAMAHNLSVIHFDVLHTNRGMRALVQKLGGTSVPNDDPGVVHYRLEVEGADVDPTAGALYLLMRLADEHRDTAGESEISERE